MNGYRFNTEVTSQVSKPSASRNLATSDVCEFGVKQMQRQNGDWKAFLLAISFAAHTTALRRRAVLETETVVCP